MMPVILHQQVLSDLEQLKTASHVIRKKIDAFMAMEHSKRDEDTFNRVRSLLVDLEMAITRLGK